MQPKAPAIRPAPLLESDSSIRPWRRLAYGSALILAATGIFTCACDTPMIWDGAYQFCFSLITQRPYFYLTRFHSYILWTPMIWLSHVTHNLTVLKMAYGLPFTLAPAASVILSWLIVRKRAPQLILWGILGAAAAPLPGQIFIINDSIFQQHVFWPVFLGLLVALRWPQIILVCLLAVFQFSHQIGFVLLLGGAVAAALTATADVQNRDQQLIKCAVALALADIALWKIWNFPDSYAQREFTWKAAHGAWQWGVEGWPLRGLYFVWGAGACVLLLRAIPNLSRQLRIGLILLAVCGVVGAAAMWLYWASDPKLWSTAANYRRWIVPLTIPLYVFAFLDRWLSLQADALFPSPGIPGDGKGGGSEIRFARPTRLLSPLATQLVGYGCALIFALVIGAQSISWLKMTRRLVRSVDTKPDVVIPWSVLAWSNDTALQHWGTSAYVYVLEGRQPRHIVLDRVAFAQQLQILRQSPPQVPLAPFTPVSPSPGPAGWFDFRPMMQRARLSSPSVIRLFLKSL